MEDDPAQRLAKANRVSIRAVLVSDQNVDVQSVLAKAGIFDPVAIPVLLGDKPDVPHGIFGDGVTPNLTGILEPDAPDALDARHAEPAPHEPGASKHASGTRRQPLPTANLPAAFGLKPMAPVRRRPT